MKKRLLSILLVFVIVLSTLPIPAFAEDGGEAAPTCICETACTAEAMNEDCPVCGAEGAHLHDCAKYVEGAENPAETTTPRGTGEFRGNRSHHCARRSRD